MGRALYGEPSSVRSRLSRAGFWRFNRLLTELGSPVQLLIASRRLRTKTLEQIRHFPRRAQFAVRQRGVERREGAGPEVVLHQKLRFLTRARGVAVERVERDR